MVSISSCTPPSASLFTKPINTCSSSSSSLRLSTLFPGTRVVTLRIEVGPSNGSRTTCWFKFGKNGVDADQSPDDFDRDDVEQYFNYMEMLAVEAASEGDKPKIEELLKAGADYTVKDAEGRTALDRVNSEDIRDLILGFLTQKA